ncbi:MAG: hypothetical protein M3P53_10705 [Actinomycetota bacterium]|nr:hypothetical protein [Actinomycetota bacterium]
MGASCAQLDVRTRPCERGETITVTGTRAAEPRGRVEIRLDPNGWAVLATFQTDSPLFAAFGPGQVTIPAATEPVPHALVATQVLGPEDDFHIRDVPARAAIAVSARPSHPPRRLQQPPCGQTEAGVVRVTVSKIPD